MNESHSDIERFKDDDMGYSDWTRRHWYTGYVLHRASRKEFTLHMAGCDHIYGDVDSQWRMTHAEKICSASDTALKRLVRSEGGKPPVGCSSCGTSA